LIATFITAEHLLNIAETVYPSSKSATANDPSDRTEPDDFYTTYHSEGNAANNSPFEQADESK
jgi:hypothetical protein